MGHQLQAGVPPDRDQQGSTSIPVVNGEVTCVRHGGQTEPTSLQAVYANQQKGVLTDTQYSHCSPLSNRHRRRYGVPGVQ